MKKIKHLSLISVLFLISFIQVSCDSSHKESSEDEIIIDSEIENTESEDEADDNSSSYDYLVLFDTDSYPLNTDVWKILDETATTESFAGLSAAIESVSRLTPEREISLIFPNLDNIPDFAIFGTATHSDTMSSSAIVSLTANNAKSIGTYAFYMCISLKTVEATSALEVGYYAFYGCTSLESVILPSATAINEEAFSECLLLSDLSTPNCTEISLPSSLTIGNNSFSSNSIIENVYANNVETIGDYAFYDCIALSYINISSVKTIGTYAFGNCVSLPSIDIPVVTSIASGAFSGCSLIASIELPLLTTLEDYVFYNCSSLESVTLAQITTLGSSSLSRCSSLITLSLATNNGAKLSSIAADAFADTETSLITLTLGLNNADYVNGNTLTIGDFSAEFKEIIILGLEATGPWDGNIATQFSYGNGSISNPYQISTSSELAYLAQEVNNGNSYSGYYLILNNSIDLNNIEWTAIGTSSKQFKGTFDGCGYTIDNLYIDNTSSYQGLFGYVSSSGVISNLTVNGSVTGSSRVASIAGYNAGTITECLNQCLVSGIGYYTGGVVGYNDGDVTNCYNIADITAGSDDTGGVVGWNSGYIANCYNQGDIIGSKGNFSIGGIVGCSWSLVINCYNRGDISSPEGSRIGGIVGNNLKSYSPINCYNTGYIAGSSKVNGIVGGSTSSSSYYYTPTNSYSIENCVLEGTTLSNASGTSMSLEDMQSSDFVTTLNDNIETYMNSNSDATLLKWIQDPVTLYPMFDSTEEVSILTASSTIR